MKKIFFLFLSLLLFTGCVNINKSSYEEIINYALTNSVPDLKNKTSQGYSFYLPIGLNILEDNKTNIVLKREDNTMYLYLDLISYYNKIKEEYREKKDVFYSKKLQNNDKFGYLEINLKDNNKYLIEIMYNYAKIEVIVDECDIKETLAYAIALLSSITYNDTMIGNMIGENILNYNEIEFDIFETAKNESGSVIQYNGTESHPQVSEELPDTDLIN